MQVHAAVSAVEDIFCKLGRKLARDDTNQGLLIESPHPPQNQSSNHPFSGSKMFVSGRVVSVGLGFDSFLFRGTGMSTVLSEWILTIYNPYLFK